MKKWIIVLLSFLLITWVFLGIQYFNEPKVGWLDLKKVFGEFDYKKVLETELSNVQKIRQYKIDSMENELKLMSRKLNSVKKNRQEDIDLFVEKREKVMLIKKQNEEDNSIMTEQYDSKIFRQLNQYVQDFGKENGFSIIHGSDGSGTLMYAEKDIDVTDEVILYINKRYRGLSK